MHLPSSVQRVNHRNVLKVNLGDVVELGLVLACKGYQLVERPSAMHLAELTYPRIRSTSRAFRDHHKFRAGRRCCRIWEGQIRPSIPDSKQLDWSLRCRNGDTVVLNSETHRRDSQSVHPSTWNAHTYPVVNVKVISQDVTAGEPESVGYSGGSATPFNPTRNPTHC